MSHPTRRTESSFLSEDRTRLVRRSWHGPAPERCVAIVHGFAEHSGRYDAMGDWLASRSCSVHSYDHRGHGLSEGRRTHVGHFDEYVDDLIGFLGVLRSEHPELPLVLIGHSMGGLIVATALTTRSPAVDCAVLSGPALAIPPNLSRGKQWAARLLARVTPTLRSASGLSSEGLSRDPEVIRRYEADPLIDTALTASLGAAMLRTQRVVAKQGARVSVPLLGLHGADDPICPSHGTVAFMADVPIPGSACKLYPGLRHEIFNEPEREQVWQDVLDFAKRTEGGPASG